MTLDLKRLLELAEKATPGPWEAVHDCNDERTVILEEFNEDGAPVCIVLHDDTEEQYDQATANIAYLTALNPETVKTLVERLLEAEALQWRPIETAPKDGTRVLVLLEFELPFPCEDEESITTFKPSHQVDIAYWTDFNKGGWVTHLIGMPVAWMPLPEAFLGGGDR